MNISILCPTRGRPELATRMAESALATASDTRGLEILFWLNEDDPQVAAYRHLPFTVLIMGKDGPTSYAWNELAKQANGDILMLMGDDVVFTTPGWDVKLRNELCKLKGSCAENPGGGIGVFSFDDGRSPLGTAHPHPAMTREAYNRLGYLACPMFRHFCVDTWLTEVAKAAGCFHYLPDVQLQHLKPWEVDGVPDETKARVRSTTVHEADLATFEWAKEQGFMHVQKARLQGIKLENMGIKK